MKKFVVIGLGSIAKRHISNLRKLHPLSRIYAVSSSGQNDSLPNDADAIITLDEVMDIKPQYAVIASPANFHVSTAKILLKHQIPVLIEKPLSHNSKECIDLELFYAHNPSKLAVGYCLRFLPSIKAVKKYLDDENLGKIYNVTANVGQYLPSWRSDKNYKDSVSANKSLGGGALLELSHELDYLFWLFGKLMLKYSWLRTSDELGIDVEDIADLVLVSKDNVYINVHMDFIQKSTYRNCEIIAEKGRLEWDLMSNKVILHAEQGSSIIYSDPSYDMNNMYLDMLRTFENDSMVYSNSLGTLKSSSDIIKLVDKAKKTNQWKKIN